MTAGPYPDVAWLTAERWAAIIEEAEDYGATGFHRREDGFDWDDLVRCFESAEEPWPDQWDHPMIEKFKRVVRKAWREANE